MAADMDDFLDEVENWYSKERVNVPTSASTTATASTTLTEDLDALLTELPPAPHPPPPHPAEGAGTDDASSADVSKKCWPAYVGAEGSTPAGVSLCSHLHCLECDSRVLAMDGWQWAAEADYYFLRTNYPDVNKLRQRQEPRRRCRAYACQCRQISVMEALPVGAHKGNTWVCVAAKQ